MTEPLHPDPADEGAHVAGDEQLWNESWYFDFADAGQGIGGWIRLGLIPNEGIAWVNALVCGPDIPTIAVNDFAAAPPDDPYDVHTGEIDLIQRALEPLRTYRVAVRGNGQAFEDPAGLLHDATGTPAELALDLTWSTDGTPYQYRITPRYEIPCTVSGTLTAAGREYELKAVPGQRDHSWGGVRDWWGMNWVWSALHLDDGSHLHGVEIRIAGFDPIGIGYRQQPGEPLVEPQIVAARETFGDNDLPLGTTLTLDDTIASIDIRGHAPVRLVALDGRVSHFPRAWATVTTTDGRSGVGWVEWNRVQQDR
jgi:hypothetical protein